MTTETLKALTYITEVAVSELSILEWIQLLSKVYPNGIDESAKFGSVITYFADSFPELEERAKDNTQQAYDKLYEDYIEFIKNK